MPNKLIDVCLDKAEWNGQRYIFHQCQRVDRHPFPGSPFEDEWGRCGADATWLVAQLGELTGREFTLHLCEAHARSYVRAFFESEEMEAGMKVVDLIVFSNNGKRVDWRAVEKNVRDKVKEGNPAIRPSELAMECTAIMKDIKGKVYKFGVAALYEYYKMVHPENIEKPPEGKPANIHT